MRRPPPGPPRRARRVSNHPARIVRPVTRPQFADPPLVRIESGGVRLAALARAGDPARPIVVWLGGFKSDMRSTKASRLDAWAAGAGRAFLRFDYSGHGESGGDALAPTGRLVLVGSSMGGWIALLLARALAGRGDAARLAGLVLIAPAVDFTQALMWAGMPEDARAELMRAGRWLRPSDYSDEPYVVTRALIEEGREHLLLGKSLRAHAPVRILQGMQDADVPWRHAQTVYEHLAADPATITYVKDGDHRLSREEDLALLIKGRRRHRLSRRAGPQRRAPRRSMRHGAGAQAARRNDERQRADPHRAGGDRQRHRRGAERMSENRADDGAPPASARKPMKDEAAPARSGNGVSAEAVLAGSVKPMPHM
ncbi:MAG: alpha/beta fold hydrolase [Rhizobiales bacterium]|nr:alpha/beta fold hydrolase [Hyphomicrobiales bacterium]